jgi:hypothetical protein
MTARFRHILRALAQQQKTPTNTGVNAEYTYALQHGREETWYWTYKVEPTGDTFSQYSSLNTKHLAFPDPCDPKIIKAMSFHKKRGGYLRVVRLLNGEPNNAEHLCSTSEDFQAILLAEQHAIDVAGTPKKKHLLYSMEYAGIGGLINCTVQVHATGTISYPEGTHFHKRLKFVDPEDPTILCALKNHRRQTGTKFHVVCYHGDDKTTRRQVCTAAGPYRKLLAAETAYIKNNKQP